MGLFHKSVNKRVDIFLLEMEKVWAEYFAFNDEMLKLCDNYQTAMDHVMAFAEYVDKAKQDAYILSLTKNLLQQQCDKLTKIHVDNMPHFAEILSKVKPMMEETIGYLEVVTKKLQKLSDNRNSEPYSERMMAQFDKSLAKYQRYNAQIRKRFDVINTGITESEEYYHSLKKA